MKYLKDKRLLFPVLFGFFIMGFVDVVGISTSYVKKDFGLNDTFANLLPMMAFLWFAAVSIPTGFLMGKIGRKNTVLASGLVTVIAMLIPFVEYKFHFMLLTFALLGIGNTILQVSVPSLLTDVVEEKMITSTLTLGYFIKAVSSFLGPVLIGMTVACWGNWKYVFLIYAVSIIISMMWLWFTPIEEKKEVNGQVNSIKQVIALLGNKVLLCLFSIILLSVGFEVGLVTEVPKYFSNSFQISLEQSAIGCSVYYAARTVGTFIGAIVLVRISSLKFITISLLGTVMSLVLFILSGSMWIAMVSLSLLGLSFSNVFSITLSLALQRFPLKTNEISSLMITGIAGGALIPPLLGILSDISNQFVSFLFLLLLLLYMLWGIIHVVNKQHSSIKV